MCVYTVLLHCVDFTMCTPYRIKKALYWWIWNIVTVTNYVRSEALGLVYRSDLNITDATFSGWQTIHLKKDARYFFDNFTMNLNAGGVGLWPNLFYFYRTDKTWHGPQLSIMLKNAHIFSPKIQYFQSKSNVQNCLSTPRILNIWLRFVL